LRKPPRRFGPSVRRRTHTQPPVEYPSGKPLEAKLRNELAFNIPIETSNFGANVWSHASQRL